MDGIIVHHYLGIIISTEYTDNRNILLKLHKNCTGVGRNITNTYDDQVVLPLLPKVKEYVHT